MVLGEKRPLVRIEGFTRTKVDDQLITFHLTEVRIDRDIELFAGINLPKHFHARFRVDLILDPILSRIDIGEKVDLGWVVIGEFERVEQ